MVIPANETTVISAQGTLCVWCLVFGGDHQAGGCRNHELSVRSVDFAGPRSQDFGKSFELAATGGHSPGGVFNPMSSDNDVRHAVPQTNKHKPVESQRRVM